MINNNFILGIKYIFLNFAQALFSEHYKYKWDANIKNTKIIIADRHAIDIGVAIRRPSIILQRGDFRLTDLVRGKNSNGATKYTDRANNKLHNYNSSISEKTSIETYTDLVYGSIVFNIVCKNGVQAEIIADHLFKNLIGYYDYFKFTKIREIKNLNVSQEQIVKANVEEELVGVQISFSYTAQPTIIREEKTYNCYVYEDEIEKYEFIDFEIITNGTQIQFKVEPTTTPIIDFTNAVTLEYETGIELIATEDSLIYSLPDDKAIAGYYTIIDSMFITDTTESGLEVEITNE